MKPVILRPGSRNLTRCLITIICATMLAPGQTCCAKSAPSTANSNVSTTNSSPSTAAVPVAQETTQEAPKVPPEQLDSLVAPIALYPDPMLSQVLVASTYPLELIQLQQWLERNKGLKDKALVDAVSKQTWDPSIQAMAALPDVVKRLADDIQWTTDLGNAFLAQQTDVMDAVQRMRQKAQGTGALQSNEQQRVETRVVEEKTVIVVEQSNPEVVYVPSYNPTVVYGAPVYPYPPIYYPPYSTGAVVAASAISFGVGVAMGAAWGGGWGWGCGWGHGDVDINMNNNFNRNTNISGGNRTNISGGNRTNVGGGNKWQHNPQHRGGAPYRDRATANKFGGTARGDSLANRQAGARQQVGRQGGNLSSARDRAGVSDRAGGRGGDRAGGAGVSDRAGGRSGDRAGASDRAGGRSGDRAGGAGVSDRSRSGGGDRGGSRDMSRSSGSRDRSAFGGGGSGGFSGSRARESSSRGSSSFGGGGGSRGGGGFGGGSRGGGGGSRGGGGRRG